MPPRRQAGAEASVSPLLVPVLFLAGIALLAGCESYPRFDRVSVVSLNSHFAAGVPLWESSALCKLEGSWTVTNTYTTKRQVPGVGAGTMQSPDRKPQPMPPPAEVARRGAQDQPSPISEAATNSVETTLIVEKQEHSHAFIVTVETRLGGELTERHPYLTQGTNIAGSTFIELFPGCRPMQPYYLPVWWLMRVQQKGDGRLEMACWNEAWLRKLLAKRPRTIRHALPYDKEGPIVLTDSSEAIQRFLRRYANRPEAFEVTTFYPGGGKGWPAEALKNTVCEVAGGLEDSKVREALGKDKMVIQVNDIVNQTAEPIDTRFMSYVLQTQISSSSQYLVLNNLWCLDSDFAKDIAPRIVEATLSGAITQEQPGDGDTKSRRCVLRLTLRNRQDRILWESEKPFERRGPAAKPLRGGAPS